MDWRAIGIAIVVNLMFWVVGVAVTFIVSLEAGGMGLTIYLWFSRVLAVLSDVATGATAGWLAGKRGGAFLEFLEGKTLPAVAALEARARG